MWRTASYLINVMALIVTVVSLNACSLSADAAQAQVPDSPAGDQHGLLAYEQNTIDIVKHYKDSVVAINVTVRGERVNPLQGLPPGMRQFFQQFGGMLMQPQQETERAAGSGFVVDSQGRILTNYHVIAGALRGDSIELGDNASITVQFPGGKPLPVKVIGVDQSYDVALLQLQHPDQLPAAARAIPLANSDRVQVGEKAIAIGNPFTLQSTVTEGIVSAINREQAAKVSGVPIPYIQTDAAINPGNSGGPLLNSQGQVIGVNDEILAPNGTFIGVGFAIPSNLVRAALPKMQAGGFIKKAKIGIVVAALKNYPPAVRHELGLPDHGLMIVNVKPDSPGDQAGLRGAQYGAAAAGRQWPVGGDVILEANGTRLDSGRTLRKIVLGAPSGSTVTLKVLRNGHERTVKVQLSSSGGHSV